MLFLVIGLAVLLASFALLSFKKREIGRIMKRYIEGSAIVTSTKNVGGWSEPSGDLFNSYTRYIYKYRINGNEHQGDSPGSLEVGSEVEILINASDNSISMPKKYIHSDGKLFFIRILCVTFLSIGTMMCALGLIDLTIKIMARG